MPALENGKRFETNSAGYVSPLIVAVSLSVLVLIWYFAIAFVKPELVPGPIEVLKAFVESGKSGQLVRNLQGSLKRVLVGFGAASLIGIMVGGLIGNSKVARSVLAPVLEFTRPIPPLAWIPMAIALFGVGDPPSYFIIFLGAFYPIFSNTALGIQEIPSKYLEVASVLGAGAAKRYAQIVWPGALPNIFTGLRIGLGFAWMCLIAAEMLAVKSGLGDQIQTDRLLLRLDRVVAGMIVIGVVGFLMSFAMQELERYALPWRRSHVVSRTPDEPTPKPSGISDSMRAALSCLSGCSLEIRDLSFGFDENKSAKECLSVREAGSDRGDNGSQRLREDNFTQDISWAASAHEWRDTSRRTPNRWA